MGIPIILHLYWVACKVSTPMFMVTNSVPNTDVSMVDCFLENQLMSDIFMLIMNPVLDLLVHLFQAWLMFTNIHRFMSFPLGGGALGGIASTAPS